MERWEWVASSTQEEQWMDVTHVFQHICRPQIPLDGLCTSRHFQWMESMSAIECMDPQMDSGCVQLEPWSHEELEKQKKTMRVEGSFRMLKQRFEENMTIDDAVPKEQQKTTTRMDCERSVADAVTAERTAENGVIIGTAERTNVDLHTADSRESTKDSRERMAEKIQKESTVENSASTAEGVLVAVDSSVIAHCVEKDESSGMPAEERKSSQNGITVESSAVSAELKSDDNGSAADPLTSDSSRVLTAESSLNAAKTGEACGVYPVSYRLMEGSCAPLAYPETMADVVATIDYVLRVESAYLAGESLATSLLTCVYTHPEVLQQWWEQKDNWNLYTRLLMGYVSAVMWGCQQIRQKVLQADLFEEDDFNMFTFHMKWSLLDVEAILGLLTEEVGGWPEHLQGRIRMRVEWLKSILALDQLDWTSWQQTVTHLQIVQDCWKDYQPATEGIVFGQELEIGRVLATTAPLRPATIPSHEQVGTPQAMQYHRPHTCPSAVEPGHC